MADTVEQFARRWYASPLAIMLLVFNALCFGGLLVLLALTGADGPRLLLTIGTGLGTVGGVMGLLVARRRRDVA